MKKNNFHKNPEKVEIDTGHWTSSRVSINNDFLHGYYKLRAHAELLNNDFPLYEGRPYGLKSIMQPSFMCPTLDSEISKTGVGNFTIDEDSGENKMRNLCNGGCGKIARYRGWCNINWKSGNKFCPKCPKTEQRRAKNISLYRLQESKSGLNPMQNPEICKKNHSEERNRKAALTLKKLGKKGLLPQQIEPEYLKKRRLARIRKVLRHLAAQKRLPQQTESIELRARRILRIGELLILRSKWEAEVAKLLDSLNVVWQYEPFYVKYFNTEKRLMSNTLPDFYLPEQNLMIEVKGASISLPSTKDKMRWLHKQGYNVLLIGRKEIKLIRRNEISDITKKIFQESAKLCQKLN